MSIAEHWLCLGGPQSRPFETAKGFLSELQRVVVDSWKELSQTNQIISLFSIVLISSLLPIFLQPFQLSYLWNFWNLPSSNAYTFNEKMKIELNDFPNLITYIFQNFLLCYYPLCLSIFSVSDNSSVEVITWWNYSPQQLVRTNSRNSCIAYCA